MKTMMTYEDPYKAAKAKAVLKSIGFPVQHYNAMFDMYGRPWKPALTTQHLANKAVADCTYVSEEVIKELLDYASDFCVMLATLIVASLDHDSAMNKSQMYLICSDLVQYIVAMSEPNEFEEE